MSKISGEFQKDDTFCDQLRGDEEKPLYECSQYLLIDERDGESKCTYFGQKPEDSCDSASSDDQKQSIPTQPVSLRFACVLGFVFCSIFGLGILLWALVMTVFATASLFQNKNRNSDVVSLWKIVANTAIAGFGFTVGMINPAFGLSLIAVYFSMSSNHLNDDVISEVIRRTFN